MISLILIGFFIFCYIAHQFVLKHYLEGHKFKGKNFVFDPEILYEISKKGIGKPKEEMFEIVHQELQRLYPNHIWTKRHWLWFNSGGWMGTMCFLHASLTEYVILFGAPNPTSGHSGRYPLEVSDFVMEGEYYTSYEFSTDANCYKAGDRSYLPSMRACNFCIRDHAWMLEYGRGLLPLSLPFQMAGTFSSTLDFVSLFRTQFIYAKYLLYELIYNWKI